MEHHAHTRILSIETDETLHSSLVEASAILRAGGIVAFPTETVYGLGADATNPDAVAKVFAAKGRPAMNPLIVHAEGVEMARLCVAEWSDFAQVLAEHFWPGPLTMVLPRSAMIPDIVTAGEDTVGVRVPAPEVARRLIDLVGRPLAAPSANRSSSISPTTAAHVIKDLDGRIDLILSTGPTSVGLESTIVDLTTRHPRILRPGKITAAEIESALGGIKTHEAGPLSMGKGQSSPGQLPVHYAPRTASVRLESAEQIAGFPWPANAALIVFGAEMPRSIPARVRAFHFLDSETAMRELYAVLHLFDEMELDIIVIVPPPQLPEWHAIRDRLARATRPWPDTG
jgi:L-threonylcarbamoyladenylate synthase